MQPRKSGYLLRDGKDFDWLEGWDCHWGSEKKTTRCNKWSTEGLFSGRTCMDSTWSVHVWPVLRGLRCKSFVNRAFARDLQVKERD